ncbi:hypothetical protein OK016_04990 [Vibrio chagasii]|nr:hypothetical protein [Vibrio chagasii]
MCWRNSRQGNTTGSVWFSRLKNNTGFVLFECYQAGEADKLIKEIDFQSLDLCSSNASSGLKLKTCQMRPYFSNSRRRFQRKKVSRCGDIRIETP